MNNRLWVGGLAGCLAVPLCVSAATSRAVSVSGTLNGGAKSSAGCTIPSTVQASGFGRLFSAGYSYIFALDRATTSASKISLYGNFTAHEPPAALTATVPSGS